MLPIEQTSGDREENQRLAARVAIHWAEHRELADKLAAIEASTAWPVAHRLVQLRRRLLPDGSRRHGCFRLAMRGLRLWRRAGSVALLRRTVGKLMVRLGRQPAATQPTGATAAEARNLKVAAAPKQAEFRVAFIGSGADCEAQSMRYRAHNIIEALALVGVEGTFFPLEEVQANLDPVLSYGVIVLVRLMHNPVTARVIEAARRLGLPVVYDIDDYLFDPWVMPYIEAFRVQRQIDALRIMDAFGACLRECAYFTGSTSYLAEQAAALGKKSFILPNGLNVAQIQLAEAAREQRQARRHESITRLGYFSGTRTHQADFRVLYPALRALLRQRSDARLVIVGTLDLGEFPGLLPYSDAIETIPFRPWRELPALLANVDINLIPLEVTPFNEGKSNLKYYEAGVVEVPSIASPTRIHCENITSGHNGLLARTPEEWYDCLMNLVSSGERRYEMGQKAREHVLRHYAPSTTAQKVLAIYREILAHHRARQRAA